MVRTFINTTNVGLAGRGHRSFVDDDWHAICVVVYKGVEGAEWESLYCKFVEMNKEVNVRKPGESSRAEFFFWKMMDAKLTRGRLRCRRRCGGWKCGDPRRVEGAEVEFHAGSLTAL